MVKKKIVWSLRAQQDRLNILEYWIGRNNSKTYSEKLSRFFISATELISKYPKIGKPTKFKNVKVKIIRDYLMIYQNKPNQIEILVIWDSRQKPLRLKKHL